MCAQHAFISFKAFETSPLSPNSFPTDINITLRDPLTFNLYVDSSTLPWPRYAHPAVSRWQVSHEGTVKGFP